MRNKILICIYLILLTIVSFKLYGSPARGYEISIYSNTPFLVLLFIYLSVFFGICLIIFHVINQNDEYYFKTGFFLILSGNMILTALPALRGYFFYSDADPTGHYAYTQDIVAKGFAEFNMYPLIHVLLGEFTIIGGIDTFTIMKFLPSILSTLFLLNTYLLSTVIFNDRNVSKLVAVALAPLLLGIHHVAVYPRATGLFFLPLVIYLYFKERETRSIKYSLPLILFLVAFAFLHPHLALMLVVFLFTIPVFINYYENFWIKKKKFRMSEFLSNLNLNPLYVIFITFVTWISGSLAFGTEVRKILEMIRGQSHSVLKIVGGSTLQLEGFDIILFFLKSWGHVFIYISLAGIAFIIIVMRIKRSKPGFKGLDNALYLIVWCIIGEIFAIFALTVLYFGRGLTSAILNRDALIPLTPIFVGYILYEIINRFKLRDAESRREGYHFYSKIFLMVLIVLIPFTISFLGLFYSPWVYRASEHITSMDYHGVDWMVDNSRTGQSFNGLALHHSIPHLIESWDSMQGFRDIVESQTRIRLRNYVDMPPHFGYTNYSSLSEASSYARKNTTPISYTNYSTLGEASSYARRNESDIIENYLFMVTGRYKSGNTDSVLKKGRVGDPQYGRWDINENDFVKLHQDHTVQKVYSTGESDIYLVTPEKRFF